MMFSYTVLLSSRTLGRFSIGGTRILLPGPNVQIFIPPASQKCFYEPESIGVAFELTCCILHTIIFSSVILLCDRN